MANRFTDEEWQKYQAGLSFSQNEYGAKFPDGSIVWDVDGIGQLNTREGKNRLRKEFMQMLLANNLSINLVGQLKFIVRGRITSFTKPDELLGE